MVATETIAADPATQLRITSRSGRVTVAAEQRDDIVVPLGVEVSREAETITVSADADAISVRVPEGLDLVIGTEGSRVDVTGPLGAVAIATASGRVSVEVAGSVDVRTTSGRVDIGVVGGACRVRGESGRVTVDSCGTADVATSSGRIRLAEVAGSVRAHCTSGRIDVGVRGSHPVAAETVSGRITVHLGREVDPGIVVARSVSGRVEVVQDRR